MSLTPLILRVIIMINSVEMSGLENLIRWVNCERHNKIFEEQLRLRPILAKEKDDFGMTLLMIAADAGNISAAKLLCNLGADVNAVSESGEMPLINVVRGMDGEKSRFEGECETRMKVIDCLATCGANPNTLGYQGCSALHWAIIYGRVEFVKCLLSFGGDPGIRLDDPPDCENGYELVNSSRFRGTSAQKKRIFDLLSEHKSS